MRETVNGTTIDGLFIINNSLMQDPPLYGHGTIQTGGRNNWRNNIFIGALAGDGNPDGTTVDGLRGLNILLTVNDIGAFFNDLYDNNVQLTMGPGSYHFGNASETRKLRGLLVIHEISHLIANMAERLYAGPPQNAPIPILQNDLGNTQAGAANNEVVYEHCRGLIEGPEIRDLVPNHGQAGTTEVTIRAQERRWTNPRNRVIIAENFGTGTAKSQILINNNPIDPAAIRSWSDTEIRFRIPAGFSPGAILRVAVRVAGVSSNPVDLTVQ